MDKGNDCYYKTIVCKGSQSRFIEKLQEPKDGYISDNEGRYKTDGNHGQVTTA